MKMTLLIRTIKKSPLKRSFGFVLIIMLLGVSSVIAIIVSGGDFSIIQFFSGISGGEASGGGIDTRFHSTAFQPVGKALGGVFTATIGPLSSSNFIQLSTGIFDFNLIGPANQTISNTSNATYTIILTNTGTATDNYTLTITNSDNADTAILNTSSITNLASGNSAQLTLTVSDARIGNYTTIITATSQGNTSITHTVSIITEIISDVIITSTRISPYAIVKGSYIKLYIKAQNSQSVWANVTKPDAGTEIVTLTNNANTTYSTTNLIGRYNVTFYANDSTGNIVNTTDYFETFEGIMINTSVINYNTTGINSTLTLYYRDEVITFNSSNNGIILVVSPSTIVDLEYKSYTDRLRITLRSINISEATNKPFGMDKLSAPISGQLVTYGVSNNYSFTNATVRIYYDDASFSNEGSLKLYKCDDWNFTAQNCSGNFTDITNSATKNTANDYFEYVTTSFSGFGIDEVSSSSGESSSGGGGGSSRSPLTVSSIGKCINEPVSLVISSQRNLYTVELSVFKGNITASNKEIANYLLHPSGSEQKSLSTTLNLTESGIYTTLTESFGHYTNQYSFEIKDCSKPIKKIKPEEFEENPTAPEEIVEPIIEEAPEKVRTETVQEQSPIIASACELFGLNYGQYYGLCWQEWAIGILGFIVAIIIFVVFLKSFKKERMKHKKPKR